VVDILSAAAAAAAAAAVAATAAVEPLARVAVGVVPAEAEGDFAVTG